jgi:hypothetical protein
VRDLPDLFQVGEEHVTPAVLDNTNTGMAVRRGSEQYHRGAK